MEEFFTSGRAVDLVLGLIVAEGIALFVWWGRARAISVVMTLLPGVMLLLAARAAMTNAGWIWIAAFLAAALPVHLLDVWLRRPK